MDAFFMNRAYRSLLLLCLAAMLFTTSCHKSGYNSPAVTSADSDETRLNQLFSGLRSTPQHIAVTAGFSQTVYAGNGTKLTFYPNSFKDNSGNVIRKGIINIQLTEIYTIGDMIANRAATATTDGRLLTSVGQILITATMNGEEVFANKYGVGFHATPSQQPMLLFYGNANTPDSVVSWSTPGTPQPGAFAAGTVSNSDTGIVVVITSSGPDTITTHTVIMTYYQFDSCASFGWINCDYFYGSSAQLTDVRVMMPDTSFNQSNTEVFIVFPTINAAAHMSQYDASTHTFDLPKGYYIPVGMPVDIVVATNKNGSYYYYGDTGVNTTDNMFIYAELSAASLDYIKTQLSNL